MSFLRAGVRLLRPEQWLKNAFVLAGAFFSGEILEPGILARVLPALAAFCLASSAVYVLNDLLDAEGDRSHPRKRLRPIAAGTVRPPAAIVVGAACALGALLLAFFVGPVLALLLAAYLGINAAYSRWLKHVVLLDVFCIAAGFLLRLLAGTWGVGIPPSQWFMLCTFLLSLFLGFSKRYAERMDETLDPVSRRAVVEEYSPEILRALLAITLACTLMAYGLYTMSPRTTAVHGTEQLVYTLPFASFILFRYLWLVMRRGFGENLAGEVLRDRGLLIGALVYLAVTGSLLF